MGRIKSAYEKAMERYQQRKAVSEEDIRKMEYLLTGKTLAAKYLNNKDLDLLAAIDQYQNKTREYIVEGAMETFISNIRLPAADKTTFKTNQQAMNGIGLLKTDKETYGEMVGQLEQLLHYYESATKQAFAQFKERFSVQMAESMKSLEEKVGVKLKIDPEKQPGFWEEWSKVIGSINTQYDQVLKKQKEKLQDIK